MARKDISADISSQYLQVLLQQQPDLGSVVVKRLQSCYGYQWKIDWASGGYKNPLIVILFNFQIFALFYNKICVSHNEMEIQL